MFEKRLLGISYLRIADNLIVIIFNKALQYKPDYNEYMKGGNVILKFNKEINILTNINMI